MTWVCPNCKEPLAKTGGSFACEKGHSFDVAREGYVNLLIGKQRSGHKGDTPEMLAARTQFFAGGYYEPLHQRLVDLVRHHSHKTVAEIGCGEGYYIGGISDDIIGSKCFGTDIAKAGLKQAAKHYPRVQFAVADTNRFIPLPDDSVDVVLDVFAPRNAGEFARIITQRGALIVVIPTSRHLSELREIQPLLAIQEDKKKAVEDGLSDHFKLAKSETLTVPLKLSGQAISDLVQMTPNAWFLNTEQKQQLMDVKSADVTAEFEILEFSKTN